MSDQSTYLIDANTMHNESLDSWKGWKCNAGYKRLAITPDGVVLSGECRNDYLGQLDGDWDILPGPTTCKRERCTGCTNDLMAEKYKE